MGSNTQMPPGAMNFGGALHGPSALNGPVPAPPAGMDPAHASYWQARQQDPSMAAWRTLSPTQQTAWGTAHPAGNTPPGSAQPPVQPNGQPFVGYNPQANYNQWRNALGTPPPWSTLNMGQMSQWMPQMGAAAQAAWNQQQPPAGSPAPAPTPTPQGGAPAPTSGTPPPAGGASNITHK